MYYFTMGSSLLKFERKGIFSISAIFRNFQGFSEICIAILSDVITFSWRFKARLLQKNSSKLVLCKEYFMEVESSWILKANVHRQVVFLHSLVGPRKKICATILQMWLFLLLIFFPFRSMFLYIVSLLVLFHLKNIYTCESVKNLGTCTLQ